MRLLVATFSTALIASLVLTPIVRILARRWGLVDHPDKHRKLHEHATPLGGGAAVLMAFLVAVAVVLIFSDSQRSQIAENASFFVGLISASILICVIGLVDDRFGLRGRQKLAGQVVAAGIVAASGLMIDKLQVFGFTLELGPLAVPFTVFFILGAINALNFIDGLDGLATSVGIVLSVAIAVMATLAGHPVEAFLALAVAGALIGFLFYNSPPASIFLGDAGSMLIGLVLGALAIRASLKGPATIVLAAPMAIWAIPIFDVTMAILRRRLTGRSIYTTDHGHLHHALQQYGFSNRKTVLIVGLLATVTAAGAALSVYMNNELMAYAAIIAVCAVLVAARIFGHQECSLLFRRLKELGLSLMPRLKKDRHAPIQLSTRFRGNREWEELWETLKTYAERFDLTMVDLNVSLPSIGEEFHASWRRPTPLDEESPWQSVIPLVARQVTVGRIRIAGASRGGRVCSWMSELIAGLEPFETQIQDLMQEEDSRFSPDFDLAGSADSSPAENPELTALDSDTAVSLLGTSKQGEARI